MRESLPQHDEQSSCSKNEAYCTFMRRHRETVWRVCWRFASQGRGDNVDRIACAKDMAQEVWIVLWLKFDQLDLQAPERQQRRWLTRVAHSVLIDLYRHTTIHDNDMVRLEDLEHDIEDVGALPPGNLADTLYTLLEFLPPNDQQLIRMRLEGYDAQEIADTMGTSRNNVYQRISRIIKKIKQYDP